MNFLEQLVAEWHEYNGYFVRSNVKFGPADHGGYVGEMDVIAYKPTRNEFIHIEASTGSQSWKKRKEIFEQKFTDARKYYMEVFPFKEMGMEPNQLAIVSFNRSPKETDWESTAPPNSEWGDIPIEVVHIPAFIQIITNRLQDQNPQRNAVPENYPLLRAMQYSSYLGS